MILTSENRFCLTANAPNFIRLGFPGFIRKCWQSSAKQKIHRFNDKMKAFMVKGEYINE